MKREFFSVLLIMSDLTEEDSKTCIETIIETFDREI